MVSKLICLLRFHVFPQTDDLMKRIKSNCCRCGTDYMSVFGR